MEPHNYQTPIQRAIVAWRSSIYVQGDTFTAEGCPAFQDFRQEKKPTTM
jgi:hypothetical protein